MRYIVINGVVVMFTDSDSAREQLNQSSER